MQEEEMSVSEILSSIREVLSKEVKDEIVETVSHTILPHQELKQDVVPPIRPPVFKKAEPIFELTPQMRVNKEVVLSQNTSFGKPQSVAQSFPSSQHIEANLKPMMQDWLDKNMPSIVEKVVSREVKRLFSGK